MRSQTNKVKAADKQRQALELRKAGVTYARIAEQLGYRSPSGAHKAVELALKSVLSEPAEEVRQLELERLDSMLLALWPQVRNGNHGAIDRALRVMERRARLLGLDAPVKQDIKAELSKVVIEYYDQNPTPAPTSGTSTDNR